MAKWKNINNQIKEAQQEENKIQSKRENVQRKTKEADNKLNIIGKNIFIGARCFAASESSFENSHMNPFASAGLLPWMTSESTHSNIFAHFTFHIP